MLGRFISSKHLSSLTDKIAVKFNQISFMCKKDKLAVENTDCVCDTIYFSKTNKVKFQNKIVDEVYSNFNERQPCISYSF